MLLSLMTAALTLVPFLKILVQDLLLFQLCRSTRVAWHDPGLHESCLYVESLLVDLRERY